jgi:hypothetical protein
MRHQLGRQADADAATDFRKLHDGSCSERICVMPKFESPERYFLLTPLVVQRNVGI